MRPQPITPLAPPLPGRAIASQRWTSLAFLHWRVDPGRVAPLLPHGIRPDVHDGSSWVGLIPFLLDRATLFGSPPVAYLGRFVEVNVRLYGVDDEGRRGVVFRSLEASRLLAVLAARVFFRLPYYWSRTNMHREGPSVAYRASRIGRDHATMIEVKVGERIDPTPLDHFLTARWGMFVARRGATRFIPNEHEPWALRSAEVLRLDDRFVAAAGLPGVATVPPDSILFADGVTTRFARPA